MDEVSDRTSHDTLLEGSVEEQVTVINLTNTESSNNTLTVDSGMISLTIISFKLNSYYK